MAVESSPCRSGFPTANRRSGFPTACQGSGIRVQGSRFKGQMIHRAPFPSRSEIAPTRGQMTEDGRQINSSVLCPLSSEPETAPTAGVAFVRGRLVHPHAGTVLPRIHSTITNHQSPLLSVYPRFPEKSWPVSGVGCRGTRIWPALCGAHAAWWSLPVTIAGPLGREERRGCG